MKFEIKDEQEKFNHIEIRIVLESRQELLEMWSRYNISAYAIKENGGSHEEWDTTQSSYLFWKEIDKLI